MSLIEPVLNYWAIIVTTIVSFAVGALWYMALFGKTWTKEMGFTKADMDKSKKKSMTSNYILNLVGVLIMVYVLAHFVAFLDLHTFGDAFQLAFWLWLGFFAAATLLNSVVWGGKSWKLYCIDASYWLVNLIVASWILSAWR